MSGTSSTEGSGASLVVMPKTFWSFPFCFHLAHSTMLSILLVLCKAPQQNFLVHVKGSLYSRMSFQEERRHITPTIGVRSLALLRCRPTSSPFQHLVVYICLGWWQHSPQTLLYQGQSPQVGIFFKRGAKVSYLPLRPLILQMSPLSSFTLHTILNFSFVFFFFVKKF